MSKRSQGASAGAATLQHCPCQEDGRTTWHSLLARKGNDSPTIWTAVLKGNPLVYGIPQSKHDGRRAVLKVRVMTGNGLSLMAKPKNQREIAMTWQILRDLGLVMFA